MNKKQKPGYIVLIVICIVFCIAAAIASYYFRGNTDLGVIANFALLAFGLIGLIAIIAAFRSKGSSPATHLSPG